MTSPYENHENPTEAAPSSITVRAAAGQPRIIPFWQALGQDVPQAKRTRIHQKQKARLR
jgi:hypothetical protein